jgi:HKD family nuclease
MTSTTHYYEANADTFFADTASLDMSSLHEKFLAALPKGGHILDAGCGSGRDAKAFASRGYAVTAFDASPALAGLAARHCGFPVEARTFAEVHEVESYDGVWCCASLLHVPIAEMADTLSRLWRALKPGGAFYLNYKLGRGERTEGGRKFTDVDEAALRSWLSGLAGSRVNDLWTADDLRPLRQDRWVNAIATKLAVSNRKLVTGGSDPFLPHLSTAISGATDIAIAVSFVKVSGLRLLLPDLIAQLRPTDGDARAPGRIRFLTSDYLDVTDPDALRLLSLLQQDGADVRIYVTADDSFHLKAYIFSTSTEGRLVSGTAFIGSSNISKQALQSGLEWNYRVAYPGDEGFLEARERFDHLFAHPRSLPLTHPWIEAYEKRRVPTLRAIAPGSDEQDPPPQPNPVQERALAALTDSREAGFRRGLVVLATGLGKTWLAAFDAERMGARRVLFVAHREEILEQAAETFVRIRRRSRVGFYTGASRDADADVLCASVQTLSRATHLERFAPQHFDYVVIDEFHHAAAAT